MSLTPVAPFYFSLSPSTFLLLYPRALIPLAVSAPTTTSRPCRTPIAATPARNQAFTLPELRERSDAFTLVEILVVVFIIGILLTLLVPALGPSSGRALDGATHQFTADLENARLIAIAERTRTRVLLPLSQANFSPSPAPSPLPWPTDITRRGYVVMSQKPTETLWRQRGKWTRLPQGIALQTYTQPSPTPTPTAIPIDAAGTGATTYSFSGPYIEFLANGSSSLDPSASPANAAILADGLVDTSDAFKAKNANLKSTITIDPLTGAATVK